MVAKFRTAIVEKMTKIEVINILIAHLKEFRKLNYIMKKPVWLLKV